MPIPLSSMHSPASKPNAEQCCPVGQHDPNLDSLPVDVTSADLGKGERENGREGEREEMEREGKRERGRRRKREWEGGRERGDGERGDGEGGNNKYSAYMTVHTAINDLQC